MVLKKCRLFSFRKYHRKQTGKSYRTCFILDRSGSMSGLERDTIGGFNAMINKQRKQKGKSTGIDRTV